MNRFGLKIKFSPAFSPWFNGKNYRNHYSADVIANKVMSEDRQIMLQEALNMASWTHNTNVIIGGYTPLRLMSGKSVVFPGIPTGDVITESLYDDNGVRRLMESLER